MNTKTHKASKLRHKMTTKTKKNGQKWTLYKENVKENIKQRHKITTKLTQNGQNSQN